MWTMNYKELKKDFYWTGVLDKDLRVFDIEKYIYGLFKDME